MSDKSIAQRMFIKSGNRVIILNAPEGYTQTMGEIPEQVNIQNKSFSGCRHHPVLHKVQD